MKLAFRNTGRFNYVCQLTITPLTRGPTDAGTQRFQIPGMPPEASAHLQVLQGRGENTIHFRLDSILQRENSQQATALSSTVTVRHQSTPLQIVMLQKLRTQRNSAGTF